MDGIVMISLMRRDEEKEVPLHHSNQPTMESLFALLAWMRADCGLNRISCYIGVEEEWARYMKALCTFMNTSEVVCWCSSSSSSIFWKDNADIHFANI